MVVYRMSDDSLENRLETVVRVGERRGRKVTMLLSNEDLQRATVLAENLEESTTHKVTRTEVFKRAVQLMYWAVIHKKGTELIVRRDGKEIGRMQWSDNPMKIK